MSRLMACSMLAMHHCQIVSWMIFTRSQPLNLSCLNVHTHGNQSKGPFIANNGLTDGRCLLRQWKTNSGSEYCNSTKCAKYLINISSAHLRGQNRSSLRGTRYWDSPDSKAWSDSFRLDPVIVCAVRLQGSVGAQKHNYADCSLFVISAHTPTVGRIDTPIDKFYNELTGAKVRTF